VEVPILLISDNVTKMPFCHSLGSCCTNWLPSRPRL